MAIPWMAGPWEFRLTSSSLGLFVSQQQPSWRISPMRSLLGLLAVVFVLVLSGGRY
jgi:hypothetical protein